MINKTEFTDKVKAIYPNQGKILAAATTGSEILGRYLDDESQMGITNDAILKADSLEELKKLALENQKKKDLYDEWVTLNRSL